MNNLENKNLENIFLCKVTKINKTSFEVEVLENKQRGIVYISDVSDYYVQSLKDIVQVNDIVNLVLKKSQKDINIFSFKDIRADFLRSPFEHVLEETKNGFKNLFDFNQKEIQKWKK